MKAGDSRGLSSMCFLISVTPVCLKVLPPSLCWCNGRQAATPAVKPMSLEMMARALSFGWEQQVLPAEAGKVNKCTDHQCPFLCKREKEQKIAVLFALQHGSEGMTPPSLHGHF